MSVKNEKKSNSPGRRYPRVQIFFEDPSLTKQSMKDDCDINNILKKFNKTGQLPDLIKTNPKFGDFADTLDYQESLNLVIHAQTQFEALSAAVRKRFHNDPAEFLEFVQDAKNAEEMVSLGLASKRPVASSPVALNNEPKAPEGVPPKESKAPDKG